MPKSKLEDPAAVRDDWCREYTKARNENRKLRACLTEIASDPTGDSAFQAQLAAQGLAGKYKAPRS